MPRVGKYVNRERTLEIPAGILIVESLLGTLCVDAKACGKHDT